MNSQWALYIMGLWQARRVFIGRNETLVKFFDGELAGDTITGDGEAAAEAGAELDQKRIVVVLLHGQVDGFAATQGFTSLYGFHHGISLYKLSNCSLCWQMSGQ